MAGRKPFTEPKVRINADVPFSLRQRVVAQAQLDQTTLTALIVEALTALVEGREAR